MSEAIQFLKVASPLLWQAVKSGQLAFPQCHVTEPDPDVMADYNVTIPISEGFNLTCHVYRSRKLSECNDDEKISTPVIMCAHPYDNRVTPALKKTGAPKQYRMIPQSGGTPTFSTLTSWEAPDPDVWVRAGYTVVNLNLPGFAGSGGSPSFLSQHQARCYHEAIEWVSLQPWCNGSIGLLGVSYLAISQYHVAGIHALDERLKKLECLKCIVPWEGLSDIYRDVACPGGVTDRGFLDFWWAGVKPILTNGIDSYLEVESVEPGKIIDSHPLLDDYWQSKIPNLEDIDVPMLVCASFSDQELHTMGSFRAFERVKSEKKWLYTHRAGKWSVFYDPEVQKLIQDFMDHFLKGETDNKFNDLKPVRLEIREDMQTVHEVRWEENWPLNDTKYERLYLSNEKNDDKSSCHKLLTELPSDECEVSYNSKRGSVYFELTFDENTELSGYMKLKLWVEVRAEHENDPCPEDAVLCVAVEKIRDGKPVHFYGTIGMQDDVVTRGCCRVSRRALDEQRSTEWHPVYDGTKSEALTEGSVVPVEIALCPSSTFFKAGEGIRLTVSPKDLAHAPVFHKETQLNKGLHVFHCGGTHESYLLIPKINR